MSRIMLSLSHSGAGELLLEEFEEFEEEELEARGGGFFIANEGWGSFSDLEALYVHCANVHFCF